MNDLSLQKTAQQVVELLSKKGRQLVTVESCTGGWVGKAVTDISGSSAAFAGGFVTYSNEAKQQMVGVQLATLEAHGAVSEAVAAEMAEGALEKTSATISVSITGVAGPGGGTETKPVGMVCFGWALKNHKAETAVCYFDGDREAVRQQAVAHALQGVALRLAI
ncbi:CinA family protein [Leucothrix sargassi]|nr:CinA family protein [Leucothrix sargassi]